MKDTSELNGDRLKSKILNTENQDFITRHLKTNVADLMLKKHSTISVDIKVLAEQIAAKIRCEKKLPTWFSADNIIYPNKLNIEQTSSEATATHKASILQGKKLIDLTGGFGVDCFYFSKTFEEVTHCEWNEQLSYIVKHNYQQLNRPNIKCIPENGLEYLAKHTVKYDWIYVDPSRRHEAKGKVFFLADCEPNVTTEIDKLFQYASNICIKVSPILDITQAISELKFVKEVHIVALKNEVKELLFILEKDYQGTTQFIATNLKAETKDTFSFNSETSSIPKLEMPQKFLYEPNAAILKSGGFNPVSVFYQLNKLHLHSHLYTSDNLVTFPGRRFEIINVSDFNKKILKKKFGNQKHNITTRNFPKSVEEIRKLLKIKDGGDSYLFFTTNKQHSKIVIECKKVD